MSATQRLDEVFGLPEGSEVYVLNDFKSSAYDAVRLFETLGLNQFRYIPFYPGARDEGVARPLITFGEYDDQCHYLPRCIEKIIDVGIRTIDISTIVEIMLRLGLPDEKMHQVTTNPCAARWRRSCRRWTRGSSRWMPATMSSSSTRRRTLRLLWKEACDLAFRGQIE